MVPCPLGKHEKLHFFLTNSLKPRSSSLRHVLHYAIWYSTIYAKKKKKLNALNSFFCYTVSRKNQIYLKRIEKDYELYFRHMLRA
jgi:hypothetical protein